MRVIFFSFKVNINGEGKQVIALPRKGLPSLKMKSLKTSNLEMRKPRTKVISIKRKQQVCKKYEVEFYRYGHQSSYPFLKRGENYCSSKNVDCPTWQKLCLIAQKVNNSNSQILKNKIQVDGDTFCVSFYSQGLIEKKPISFLWSTSLIMIGWYFWSINKEVLNADTNSNPK